MSEYQYFDFRAIDHPLTEKQINTLRSYSTRAEITPTKFVNEYHWGNFKGDEDAWMKKYFDLYFYYANWGTHIVKLRLPGSLLPLAAANAYCMSDCAYAIKSGTNVILNYTAEEIYDDYCYNDAEFLAAFIAIRKELATGDLRALYLGWLLSVQNREVPDDEPEPAVPPGLGQFNSSLDSFARFLNIDPDLIHVAAQASPDLKNNQPSKKDIRTWIAGRPVEEKDTILTRIIADNDFTAATELHQHFLKYHQTQHGHNPTDTPAKRTVAELLAAAELRTAEREKAEARKRAEAKKRRDRQAALARAKYLDTITTRQPKLWTQINNLIATKQPNRYDEAVNLLIDLRDLAQREGKATPFNKKRTVLRETHSRKPSLLARLSKAGL
jgi:hypothetical protein